MTTLQIKAFKWQHWAALWELREQQLAEHGITMTIPVSEPDLSSPYERDYHRIDQVYLKGAGNFWIAWLGDRPVGHVGAQDLGGAVELRRMYVRADARGRGVGTGLVRKLTEHCSAQGVQAIELWTDESGPGRFLYERIGFRLVAEPGEAFKDVPLSPDEIRMRLDLR
jgi:GNAT superfamily N-acetyltransferase